MHQSDWIRSATNRISSLFFNPPPDLLRSSHKESHNMSFKKLEIEANIHFIHISVIELVGCFLSLLIHPKGLNVLPYLTVTAPGWNWYPEIKTNCKYAKWPQFTLRADFYIMWATNKIRASTVLCGFLAYELSWSCHPEGKCLLLCILLIFWAPYII